MKIERVVDRTRASLAGQPFPVVHPWRTGQHLPKLPGWESSCARCLSACAVMAEWFGVRASGNAKSMSQSNSETKRTSASNRSAAAKARRATAKATAPASQAADKAAEKSDAVESAAVGAAERTAGASTAVVHGAAERVQAGRQAVIAASGQAVAFAKTAWTLIAQRKLLAAGVGAGLSALGTTSYLAGRRAGRRTEGPITRLTGGRI
ncbi:hypothetical protein ABT052_02325 [Streptomyces sp. NPDC002766]|uniref:hypothetical protein n=1 Tax=unclassified Streptomyces TaxID=2593676 RepID=UPI003325CF2B